MPVKLGSKLPGDHSEARIEIIPLIDIMFFLLAAFMLVSLSMVRMRSVKVDLPTATTATPDKKRDILTISVDPGGVVYLDQTPVAPNELMTALATVRATNQAVRVFISGDRACRHGDVIQVLDWVRRAGIDKVAFAIQPHSGPSGSSLAPP